MEAKFRSAVCEKLKASLKQPEDLKEWFQSPEDKSFYDAVTIISRADAPGHVKLFQNSKKSVKEIFRELYVGYSHRLSIRKTLEKEKDSHEALKQSEPENFKNRVRSVKYSLEHYVIQIVCLSNKSLSPVQPPSKKKLKVEESRDNPKSETLLWMMLEPLLLPRIEWLKPRWSKMEVFGLLGLLEGESCNREMSIAFPEVWLVPEKGMKFEHFGQFTEEDFVKELTRYRVLLCLHAAGFCNACHQHYAISYEDEKGLDSMRSKMEIQNDAKHRSSRLHTLPLPQDALTICPLCEKFAYCKKSQQCQLQHERQCKMRPINPEFDRSLLSHSTPLEDCRW